MTTTTIDAARETATVAVMLTYTEAINAAIELRQEARHLRALASDFPKLASQFRRDADQYEHIAATIDAARTAATIDAARELARIADATGLSPLPRRRIRDSAMECVHTDAPLIAARRAA